MLHIGAEEFHEESGSLLKDMVFIKASSWRAKIQTTPSRKKQKMNPAVGALGLAAHPLFSASEPDSTTVWYLQIGPEVERIH